MSTTDAAVGGEDRRRWVALAVIVTAQFMVVLDVAIVNVALSSIKTDLHFSQESLQWVITPPLVRFDRRHEVRMSRRGASALRRVGTFARQ